MKAERARRFARLARLFGCSVADVRAMTPREVEAMLEAIDEERRAQPRR